MIIDGKRYRKNLFGQWVPAMEAGPDGGPEDLTATTDTMMRQASGKRADPGNMEPPTTSDDTQAQNDDLANGTPPPEGGDDPIGDLEDAAAPPGGEDGGADIGGDTGGDAGGDTGTNPSPDQLRMPKNHYKLFQDMSNFRNSCMTTYETLTNYSTPAANEEQRKIYSSAINHLTDMQTLLDDMLTSPFDENSYVTKLRKYVALRHVYSSVLDMLAIYFDILDRTGARDSEGIDNA